MPELTTLNKRIAELEAELEHIRKRYKLQGQHLLQKDDENQRLLAKIADWQDRFTEGLLYDEDNNQTVLVWTQREIDQAKSEADELCRKLGIPLEKEG
jgi:chromosome segregation ATPase